MLGPEADLRQLFSGLALVAVACVHRQFQPDRHQHNALFLQVNDLGVGLEAQMHPLRLVRIGFPDLAGSRWDTWTLTLHQRKQLFF